MTRSIILSLLALTSLNAFADIDVFENNDRDHFRFECHLRAQGKKGGALRGSRIF